MMSISIIKVLTSCEGYNLNFVRMKTLFSPVLPEKVLWRAVGPPGSPHPRDFGQLVPAERQPTNNMFSFNFYWQCSSILWVQFYYHFEIQLIGWVWWPRYMGMLMVGERLELISNQIDLNSMPWHFYWSDVEMDGRPDVSGWKQRVRGKQGWMTRKEVAGRRTWNQSIAQSVRQGPIYSNFTRECAASLPQQQSINQWKRRGPIYNLVYTAYSAFLHTASKSGVWCAGQDLLGSF